MRFIACYTDLYKPHADALRTSLNKLGLTHSIRKYKCRGSWLANCHYIPIFCLKMMEEYPDEPLCYLDADATVEREPLLLHAILDMGVDFACHWLLGKELLNGTMLLAPTEKCKTLMQLWIQEDRANPSKWEQKILQENFDTWAERLKLEWYDLPPTYCRIFDHKKQMKVQYGVDDPENDKYREAVYAHMSPCIMHWQASRKLRHKADVEGKKAKSGVR